MKRERRPLTPMPSAEGLDFLAYEPHFVDHLAPVWKALSPHERGHFIVDPDLADRARSHGVEPYALAPPRRIPAYPPPVYDGRPTVVASYGDIKKARRLGMGPFAFLEHGIGQSYTGDRRTADHASYSGGKDRDDVTLFLCPNEHSATRWRETYPSASVEVIGSPRLDDLPQREGDDGPVVAVSWHWDCHLLPETDTAFAHFSSVLPELAATYRVIGHAHPRFYGIERRYARLGIEYVRDFADVCRRADLYVCDNSSTIYEFASTGRPVVVLNAPGYRKDVSHGLRFWDAADVGIQVDRPADLLPAVERALAGDHTAERETALDIVYAHRTGAAERAAKALAAWAHARQAVAA